MSKQKEGKNMAERKAILNGIEEIRSVLGCGPILFKKYQKMKLPIVKQGRVYVAHRAAIEDFIKRISTAGVK
jgi:hypothetical protein